MAATPLSRPCLRLSQTSSASRTFLQIASRQTNRLPHLDFLAPSVPFRAVQQNIRQEHTVQCRPFKHAIRTFTTSRVKRATVAIHNPQQDDDGEDMAVEITERAAKRLKQIMTKDQNPNLALRITVESGGCHGFQYLMALTSLPPLDSKDPSSTPTPTDSAASETLHTESNTPAFAFNKTPKITPLQEDDTVFATGDTGEGGYVAKVVMDAPSLELLKGSKVDYTVELIGSQFKITDNPLATSSCGCGTSFDIKA